MCLLLVIAAFWAWDIEGADHWAFTRARRPEAPAVREVGRLRSSIDRFIQAALEAKGLSLAPEADRFTLVRRVCFDLTGLPPAPEQVERFVQDGAPDAYEQMVERYLASPRYGERWGKYWLDAAGYADSNGYFNADTDRPLAYRYRDYVIQSWNADKPLDQFVQEQVAGDELAGFKPGGVVTPDIMERLVATHFLRNAPDGTGESDGNPDEVRADQYAVLEGTTQVIGSSLLGLTLQCARCHDHKFEPITQRDYYQLYAILRPAFDLERWVKPQARVLELSLPGEPKGKIAWVTDLSATPSATHLLKRGLYGALGAVVEPAPPAVLADADNPFTVTAPAGGMAATGRRLALARWLTRPGSRASALLARVLVNRLWQHHFGTGLVPTPDNLGDSGVPPSHPELLEYLASELAADGWRVKPLQRRILGSSVYRQASANRPDAARVDPDNQLLGRFPVLRLDAEAMRDALLSVSGQLDRRLGGPYVPTRRTETGEVVAEKSHRRSVYLQQRRTQVVSLLEVFDAPSLVTTCTRRTSSAIPLQSLSLLNSSFALDQARALARRVQEEAVTPTERIGRTFFIALCRSPTDEERAAVERFLTGQPSWVDLCQMILASNAFLYLD
jgi:hypothetical protein